MPHPFLSDEWLAAARAVRQEHDSGESSGPAVRMNLTITDVPFGSGTLESHLDTSSGAPELDLGHLENPDVAVTTDYETAKAIFVVQDAAAGMQAFMTDKVVVQGDMMKLMSLNATMAVDPKATEIAAAIRAITE